MLIFCWIQLLYWFGLVFNGILIYTASISLAGSDFFGVILNTENNGYIFLQKRGFTQAQLAELVDCSNTYICLLEKGSKSMSLDMFVFVANALNVSADEVLQDLLENTIFVSNHEFAELVSDCSHTKSEFF